MGGWRLERWLSPTRRLLFKFPDVFKLEHGKTCKIWVCCDDAVSAPPGELIWNEATSWGVGINITTRLLTDKGEVK